MRTIGKSPSETLPRATAGMGEGRCFFEQLQPGVLLAQPGSEYGYRKKAWPESLSSTSWDCFIFKGVLYLDIENTA